MSWDTAQYSAWALLPSHSCTEPCHAIARDPLGSSSGIAMWAYLRPPCPSASKAAGACCIAGLGPGASGAFRPGPALAAPPAAVAFVPLAAAAAAAAAASASAATATAASAFRTPRAPALSPVVLTATSNARECRLALQALPLVSLHGPRGAVPEPAGSEYGVRYTQLYKYGGGPSTAPFNGKPKGHSLPVCSCAILPENHSVQSSTARTGLLARRDSCRRKAMAT